ncbi:MAG: hypothetical protein RO469_16715 [Thermincola sp.]|jgi:hypothetical protein|nr:hypothetical protein [Thermincola sp.]MDT3702731.1 hypothetical protein [Thermincola sp.]
MSCTSIRHRFDQLKDQGGVNFDEAVGLYDDLKGSLDAHKFELQEIQETGDKDQMFQLQQHIVDGEAMLTELKNMTLS